ncbi:F-box/LRR-repeat MAX2 homolog A-like [Nymphaea colorata]|uniref:F-box/LRR-repeat MAX2 homolog A-like n=1 Tax=Nymphaea colorata TaxID=210225 RepID=UPI00129EA98D|nr:F-box/LRR-repeat MAX2 homolog A-like [Nymphaea colorata]
MPSESATAGTSFSPPRTHLHDLPDAILSIIFSLVTDTRSRNSMSLVCRKWAVADRSSRTTLTLRGNVGNLDRLPSCFRSVTNLDLSFCSPWGHPLFLPDPLSEGAHFVARFLAQHFPNITSLTFYSRHPATVQILAYYFPSLRSVKLVRFHQRITVPAGADLIPLFAHCPSLSSLDLSHFYCWTEDIPAALHDHPASALALTHLNLLILSTDGFQSQELQAIAVACPNLLHLLASCRFDPRFVDFVGDAALLSIATNCNKLRHLHLADASSLSSPRSDPDADGFSHEDARISAQALEEMFIALPDLEDLTLDVCHNVRGAGVALEVLGSKCRRLRSLKLGQFHGICRGDAPRSDGIALCRALESLCIKNSGDLTDLGLIAIARGCPRLSKLEIHGCHGISSYGVMSMVCCLRKTLVDVGISCCKQLNAASSLQALEPIRDRVEHLHIDCVWGAPDSEDAAEKKDTRDFDLNYSSEANEDHGFANGGTEYRNHGPRRSEADGPMKKKWKCSSGCESSNKAGSEFWSKTWPRLRSLSLWIAVGELLMPLAAAGLAYCPALQEMKIKVEGDCRLCAKLTMPAFGLNSLVRFPRLSKMNLDCGEVTGYALSAPVGQMDISLWERSYLNGIGELALNQLDYWPPQDREMNSRSLTLPAVGLISECVTLRKLFIHGTANEHFLKMLLRIPKLRDMQLREDYYPAPENDMSTEMRVDSCLRFENELNRRSLLD